MNFSHILLCHLLTRHTLMIVVGSYLSRGSQINIHTLLGPSRACNATELVSPPSFSGAAFGPNKMAGSPG